MITNGTSSLVQTTRKAGAPNDNIVQKHLNIADKVIFLFPKNFSSVRIS